MISWLTWNRRNKFESGVQRRRNKDGGTKKESERELKGRKEKRRSVVEKEEDSNQDISAYILPSLPRYLRAVPLQSWCGYNRTQLYFIIDSPGNAWRIFPAFKRSTVRTFTDIANA